MRSFLTGLLIAAIVVAGAAWLAKRPPNEPEARPGERAGGAIATDSAALPSNRTPATMTEPSATAPVERAEPARPGRDELVTLDPPPDAPSGPVLDATGPAPEATTRDELVTVPVDSQPAPASRPERTMVPPDLPEPPRRDELTDAPVPGQGNTSTR